MLNRLAAGQSRAQSTRDQIIPAPTKGWVQSGNITQAPLDAAEVLDNFFPTAQSAELRSGATLYADIGASVVRLFTYTSTSVDLFGSTATGIYDCDRIAVGGDTFADVYGLSSGDWSAVQTSTSAGQFLVIANGADPMHYWDAGEWNPINGAAVNDVPYDALSTAFAVGETVTGGTSGASATIVSITQTSATAGTLKVGTITSGPFQNDEALTSAGGAATANGASSAASGITITGVDTSALEQLWLFKERIFAVEKDTMSAWYLPAESIGGAALELPLGSVFAKGGTLLFGATWSLDSGAGMDDVCIFVSSEGEIAVYEGTDPSSAATWSLAGVYEISRPLNKHAFFKAGGDLAILTEDGIIPVSEALRKDRAALQAVAMTFPIEDAWKDAVANRSVEFPITATLWQSKARLYIGVPGDLAYVANARTGAWCRYTGWNVRCSSIADDQLYFANSDGVVLKGENGGSDNGVAYTGAYVPKFSDAGIPNVKQVNMQALTYRASGAPIYYARAWADYEVGESPIPPIGTFEDGDVWGTGVWGAFVWGGSATSKTYTKWKTVRNQGYSLSVGVYVTSNTTSAQVFEILATRIRFEAARPL